jgi:RNA polymerase subunit RPABC4/transcription elongation factor Spt4
MDGPRPDIDWRQAYVTCPICGKKQYSGRWKNWKRGERVCVECLRNFAQDEIESMLHWLRVHGGYVFTREWRKRHGKTPFSGKAGAKS